MCLLSVKCMSTVRTKFNKTRGHKVLAHDASPLGRASLGQHGGEQQPMHWRLSTINEMPKHLKILATLYEQRTICTPERDSHMYLQDNLARVRGWKGVDCTKVPTWLNYVK